MLRNLFIPHYGNHFQPHLLHHKRVWFYGVFFILLKVIVVGAVLLAPERAWLSDDALARQTDLIVILTNKMRVNKKLPTLAPSVLLNQSANLKATDMATEKYFSHTDKQGRGLSYYLNQVGYKYAYAGENLAVGFADASGIVSAWAQSPSHLSNLIDKDFDEFGFSIVSGQYQNTPATFVVGHFGSPIITADNSAATLAINETKLSEAKTAVAGVKILERTATQSLLDRYFTARDVFSDWFYGIFEFSRFIYLIAFVVFAVVLTATIFIEIKHQYPHLIINGLGILILIFFLIKI